MSESKRPPGNTGSHISKRANGKEKSKGNVPGSKRKPSTHSFAERRIQEKKIKPGENQPEASASSQSPARGVTSRTPSGAGGRPENRQAPAHPNREYGQSPQKSRQAGAFARNKPAANAGLNKPFVAKQPERSADPVQVESAEELKVGDTIVVTTKRMGINGEGVGYFKRKTVFVYGALPDETVKAFITKIEPTLLFATAKEWVTRSTFRKTPDCPVYDECGGCQLQHMEYAGQLSAKEMMVREAFEHNMRGVPVFIRPIAGMEHPWAYRNKAQFQLGVQGRKVITGLYAPRTHKLVDISGCPVQHPEVNRIVEEVRGMIERLGIPIYDEKTKQGSLKTIAARVALSSGQIQLTLITVTDHLPLRDKLVTHIRKLLPSVVSIAQNVNTAGDSPQVFGPLTRILWGKEKLEESLGDVRFSLSPSTFFQLNPAQTVKLYDAVKEAAQLTGGELVVDAYCGTGTITLWLAPLAREVRGIELSQEAVEDAGRNAAQSGLRNVRFERGKAEELLPYWLQEGLRPDVIVVDPPRSGCDRRLLDAIAQVKPSRLVYVSASPASLAKDCSVLAETGCRVEWVQPVDMFPQTSHVESVSLLTWN